MRPELNQHLKERFFAQYYEQKVMSDKDFPNRLEEVEPCLGGVESTILLLRSIDQLTDEEYKEVAKCMYQDDHWLEADLGRDLLDTDKVLSLKLSGKIIDYLRSIGIALPFMGYSVEELVKAGWVKLKA
jgi:hypothetical protein